MKAEFSPETEDLFLIAVDAENIHVRPKDKLLYYPILPMRHEAPSRIFENAEKARQDLMSMSVKMAGGTAVFKPLTFDAMGSNVHFRTEGMGLTHYFYRVDNTIVWWQVRPDKAEATYKDLLNFKFFQDLAD